MIPSFQEENGYGIPGNDGKQRDVSWQSKEPNPLLYSGAGSVECHSFSDRTDPAQSRRMDGIGGLLQRGVSSL